MDARPARSVRGHFRNHRARAVQLFDHVHRAAHVHQLGRAGGRLPRSLPGGAWYSKRISKAAVWTSFIVGVGLTSGNMIAGFFGHALIASPINCGALAMLLSLAIVPLVSLATKPVDFDMDIALPSRKSATDREIEAEARAEGLEEMEPLA